MDPEPWGLLHDGIVVGVERQGDRARVRISARHVRRHLDGREGDFVFQLEGVEALYYRPYTDRPDEPDVHDPAAIVRAKHLINDAEVEGGQLVVWGALGSLCLLYRELTIALDGGGTTDAAAIRAAVQAFWDGWRVLQDLAGVHPLVREAVQGTLSPALPASILAAWRTERKSDLADALVALDAEAWPRSNEDVTDPSQLDDWSEQWRAAPPVALERLVRCAYATFDALSAERDAHVAEHGLGAFLEAQSALRARYWAALTRAVATLRGSESEPRIGRAMIRMLRSPSDDWYRLDQVAHIAGPFDPGDDTPSFADHALFLIERDADAGTAARLEEQAAAVSIEADCNGAQMAADLRALARKLRDRYPADRPMSEALFTALSRRGPAGRP